MGRPFQSPNYLELARAHLGRLLRPGDHALDATAGNGHDTLFLARCVGAAGRVTAFDIQEPALAQTRGRIAGDPACGAVTLVHASHARVSDYVRCEIRGAMFNLGYLPGGDHGLTTQALTSLAAIEQALALLSPGGGLSVVAYRGHPGGEEEYRAIRERLSVLDHEAYAVLECAPLNRPTGAVALLLERRGDDSPGRGPGLTTLWPLRGQS